MHLPAIDRHAGPSTRTIAGGAIAAAAAAAIATWVAQRARTAERQHPPEGRVTEVDGVRLHHVERGSGPPVVLIHGNNVRWRDFEASGLMDVLARGHRVIAFDRPGYGHSSRPRDRLWTPRAQAELLAAAMRRLDVGPATVVGHSMGAMVAASMALARPSQVRALGLLGGYHYPTLRADALLTAPVALPIVGDVLRYTVTALSARALLDGAVKAMFAPCDVPDGFLPALSRELLLRPGQLRANAEDAAFMMPAARELGRQLPALRLPAAIVAGADDGIVDPQAHAQRLHEAWPGSRLLIVPGAGHMVHHEAPALVAGALEGLAG